MKHVSNRTIESEIEEDEIFHEQVENEDACSLSEMCININGRGRHCSKNDSSIIMKKFKGFLFFVLRVICSHILQSISLKRAGILPYFVLCSAVCRSTGEQFFKFFWHTRCHASFPSSDLCPSFF